jgi:hypothetical protein
MRSFFAVLFSIFLVQFTACSDAPGPEESSEAGPEPIVTTAVSPVPEDMPPQTSDDEDRPVKLTPTKDTAPKPEARAVKVVHKPMPESLPEERVPEAQKTGKSAMEQAEQPLPETEGSTPPAAPVEISSPERSNTLPKAETETPKEEVADEGPARPDHTLWNELLQQFVTSGGKVNYKGFRSKRTDLQAYLDELSANPVQDNWSRSEKMAYWINAYNAFTIKLIVDNYPVKSIMDLHQGKPWDVKWIKLGSKTYSLNEIEHDILRPKYQDARIHFAVNCAARSCPPLLNQAWTGENLNTNLEKQTRSFINNPRYNSISKRKVEVSKIFEWYASDFGNLIDYLNKYSETRIDKGASVNYQEYNWALNE